MDHNQQGPQGGPQGAGMGPNQFGPDPGMQYQWSGPQGPAYGYGPPPGAYGPAPGWAGYPPGYPPGYGPQYGMGPDPAAAGFSAAMNEFADQSGLGALKGFLNFNDGEFWKGALVGAAIVLLMTNEDLRGALLGGAARTASAMKAGLGGFGEETAEGAAAETGAETGEEEQGR